jgi:hypothetical protein
MGSVYTKLVLVILVALVFPSLVNAFSSEADQGGNVHEQILREALAGLVSDANLAYMVKAANSQDFTTSKIGKPPVADARRHFDNNQFLDSINQMNREQKVALNHALDCDTNLQDRAQCLKHLAYLLHTAQDFYSRSNYIELALEEERYKHDPYSIPLVEWAKVPLGYVGKKSGKKLCSGYINEGDKLENAAESSGEMLGYTVLNKDNAQTAEGKKKIDSATYYRLARDLAVRETQRQWALFEAVVKSRYPHKAANILASLRVASPDTSLPAEEQDDLDF